ncbi:MAG: hypothetical protein DMG60_06535 [Acidobacteria bacterium]|nr:MAG: hypothetical protein DMG60_06535 [Acidobacteriota bacterium]
MANNIVICCDGTGNEFSDQNSNVVKLYSTLAIDKNQRGYYLPGVGTMGDPNTRTRIGKKWSVLTGLAFGNGIQATRALWPFRSDLSRHSLENAHCILWVFGIP